MFSKFAWRMEENALAIYKLAYDKEITDELRRRFASDISFLEKEGFRYSSLHQEVIYPFSLVFFFPIYIAMRMGDEIIKIEPPLRISSFHITYASQADATYAYVYGLGCKFYTNFSDGTWLVSNTQLEVRNDKSVIILKYEPDMLPSTEVIWKRHQEKISELLAQGKYLNEQVSFNDWVRVEQRFDQGGMWSIIKTGLTWWAIVIAVLYWLINKVIALTGSG